MKIQRDQRKKSARVLHARHTREKPQVSFHLHNVYLASTYIPYATESKLSEAKPEPVPPTNQRVMAQTYLPESGYVPPKPGLIQSFTGNYEALSPSELAEVEKRTNPHGVVTRNIILHKNFTLNDLAQEGLHIGLSSNAAKVFAKAPTDPKIIEGLKALNKSETANSEVPEKLLILSLQSTARHTNLPFATEGLVRNLKPSMKTNKDSPNYSGSNLYIPPKANDDKLIEIHSAPKNLALVSALSVHKITTKDLDDHIIGPIDYNGEKMQLVNVTPENPMRQIFASEEGVRYIRQKLPVPDAGVRIVAHDAESPIITLVPNGVMDKARRAINNAKAETEKHVQTLPTDSFGIEISPVDEKEISFTNIASHPYFANMSDADREYQMKKPRYMSIGLSVTFIPVSSGQ